MEAHLNSRLADGAAIRRDLNEGPLRGHGRCPFFFGGRIWGMQKVSAPRKYGHSGPVNRRLLLRQSPGIGQNVDRILQIKSPQGDHFDTWMAIADLVQDLPRVCVCFGSDITRLVSITPI